MHPMQQGSKLEDDHRKCWPPGKFSCLNPSLPAQGALSDGIRLPLFTWAIWSCEQISHNLCVGIWLHKLFMDMAVLLCSELEGACLIRRVYITEIWAWREDLARAVDCIGGWVGWKVNFQSRRLLFWGTEWEQSVPCSPPKHSHTQWGLAHC